MALHTLALGHGFHFPVPPAASTTAFGTHTIDATGEKVAFILPILKAGVLDKCEFRLGTVTQAPSNGLRVSFQDVDLTTGFPDGVADQYRVVTTGLTANAWVAPGLMTSDGTDGGVKRTVTKGQTLACVIEFASFVAGDNLQIAGTTGSVSQDPVLGRYYAALFTASWTKRVSDGIIAALKYDDGTYAMGPTVPVLTFNAPTVFDTGSTPDERGLIFQMPVALQIGGAWVRAELDGDADLVLYDSNGTSVIESVSLDKDQRVSASEQTLFVPFTADRTLLANTNYRLVLKPTSTTDLALHDFDVSTAALLGGVAGGTTWHYTERTNAGAWSQTTTKRPQIGIYITGIDDGISAGAAQRVNGGRIA